jgi:hypothetical protein
MSSIASSPLCGIEGFKRQPKSKLSSLLLEEIRDFYKSGDSGKADNILGARKFSSGLIDILLRHEVQPIGHETRDALIVIFVTVPKFARNKGIYSSMLKFLYELIDDGTMLVVSDVLEASHYPIYLSRGFSKYWADGFTPAYDENGLEVPSFYKFKSEQDATS